MGELAFPLAALAATFLVLVPALTVLGRLALDRRRRGAWADFGAAGGYAWLLLPTAAPVAWLISAALHALEPAQALAACRLDHPTIAACLDALVLLGLTSALLAIALLARRWQIRRPALGRALDPADPLARRVAEVVAATPALARWPVRVIAPDPGGEAPAPVFTHGALRPSIAVRADFARACLDDGDAETLRAVLLHEAAHAGGRDVLRLLLLRAALSLNPAAALLRADAERWRRAREADCDREAVALGGDPLALAHGLVRAARFGHAPAGVVALGGHGDACGHDAAGLRLRVALLLDGPRPAARRWGHRLLWLALLAVVVGPHLGGPGTLDHLHHAVERWLGH